MFGVFFHRKLGFFVLSSALFQGREIWDDFHIPHTIHFYIDVNLNNGHQQVKIWAAYIVKSGEERSRYYYTIAAAELGSIIQHFGHEYISSTLTVLVLQ